MSGILRLESLTKGNTLKQGDKTPLKYRLFDADGEKLNIAGKSATVRLVYPDFLTIGYEKGGLIVAQDDTVTFTIDSVIPSRVYHVEIIVDDKFIFPSRADESKFTVDKSSLGTEANIIEIVGVDQIVNTVLGRVDADINQAVTDINATNDAIQQAEQERAQGYQEIQQLIEDGALNAEPADGSLTTEKFADKSVTLSKLNINGYLPKSLSYSRGSLPGETISTRAHTLVSSLPSGTSISSLNPEFEFTLYVENSSGVWVSEIAWSTEHLVPRDMHDVYIAVRRVDNASLVQYLSEIGNIIEVVDENTAVKRRELFEYIEGLPKPSIDDGAINYFKLSPDLQIHFPKPLELEFSQGAPAEPSTTTRAMSQVIDLKVGDKISSTDPTIQFTIYSGDVSLIAWGTEHTVEPGFNPSNDIRVVIRKLDNTSLTESDYGYYSQVVRVASSQTNASTKGDIEKYVSLTGSDTNTGDSLTDGYGTLQKALDDGATTVYIQRGDYRNQSVTTSGLSKLTILPADTGNQKIRFIGGDKLDGWVTDGEIYKRTLSSGVNFQAVFIDKTLPPMTSASRPAPNAVLWESKDFEVDYMMTPVLTLTECQATQGTFYWDGTHIYINPQSISNEFWIPKNSKGIDLSNIGHLVSQDLVADYYLNQPLRLEGIKKIDISGFEAHHSASTDGFSLDYTYGDLRNCKAYKNRNDGFNNHFEGHVNLYNCDGINNFDDGASPHEDCSMTVYGGIYRGNAKGGVIPANGATARVYNAILENNGKGFHNADTSLGKSISSGNLYIGNTIAIQNDNSNDFTSINDKFIENTNDFVGTFDRY